MRCMCAGSIEILKGTNGHYWFLNHALSDLCELQKSSIHTLKINWVIKSIKNLHGLSMIPLFTSAYSSSSSLSCMDGWGSKETFE